MPLCAESVQSLAGGSISCEPALMWPDHYRAAYWLPSRGTCLPTSLSLSSVGCVVGRRRGREVRLPYCSTPSTVGSGESLANTLCRRGGGRRAGCGARSEGHAARSCTPHRPPPAAAALTGSDRLNWPAVKAGGTGGGAPPHLDHMCAHPGGLPVCQPSAGAVGADQHAHALPRIQDYPPQRLGWMHRQPVQADYDQPVVVHRELELGKGGGVDQAQLQRGRGARRGGHASSGLRPGLGGLPTGAPGGACRERAEGPQDP